MKTLVFVMHILLALSNECQSMTIMLKTDLTKTTNTCSQDVSMFLSGIWN